MSEQPELETSNTQRINGFAPGDRVAIINCELAGAYGKVEHSSTGCFPWLCRKDCHLVWVELSHAPPVLSTPNAHRQTFTTALRFQVHEVTHVD